jgi:hypothetical protein
MTDLTQYLKDLAKTQPLKPITVVVVRPKEKTWAELTQPWGATTALNESHDNSTTVEEDQ